MAKEYTSEEIVAYRRGVRDGLRASMFIQERGGSMLAAYDRATEADMLNLLPGEHRNMIHEVANHACGVETGLKTDWESCHGAGA